MKIYSSRYNPKDHPLLDEEMRTYHTLKQYVGKDVWISVVTYTDPLSRSMGSGRCIYIRLLKDCGPRSNFVFNYADGIDTYIKKNINHAVSLSDLELILYRTKAKCAALIKIREPLEVVTTEELVNAYGYDIDELPENITELL